MATLMLTAGVGPTECRRAVQGVAEALIEEAEALGMEACAAKITEDRSGEGWVSAVLRVDGEGASAWAAGVAGTLRWTCPSTRKEGRRRKNWFVGAVVLAEPLEAAGLSESDVRFETFRAGGPGGQHANKTQG